MQIPRSEHQTAGGFVVAAMPDIHWTFLRLPGCSPDLQPRYKQMCMAMAVIRRFPEGTALHPEAADPFGWSEEL